MVTQASSAIPVMPLYISLCFRVMREQNTYESVVEHIFRLFSASLYGKDTEQDDEGRIRMDSGELADSVQNKCKELWQQVTTENLSAISDYADYKKQFLQLFGFEIDGIDYSADVNPDVAMDELCDLLAK